jgi:hypothetical protein
VAKSVLGKAPDLWILGRREIVAAINKSGACGVASPLISHVADSSPRDAKALLDSAYPYKKLNAG